MPRHKQHPAPIDSLRYALEELIRMDNGLSVLSIKLHSVHADLLNFPGVLHSRHATADFAQIMSALERAQSNLAADIETLRRGT